MATRPSCSSGDSRSSSPIPLIGLYIAGATAVCFLLMLCDIISSFRHKTRYVPCKWFALNSATLTLLAIASKLPVDLTTFMPSAGDQLSKLTGTTMLSYHKLLAMRSLFHKLEICEGVSTMDGRYQPHPPQTLLNKLQQVGARTKGYYRLSCLSVVILVKVVALAIPLALAEPILQALDEVFELIYYIDKKINVGKFEDQRKRQFAKVLLKYKNTHLSKKIRPLLTGRSAKQYHLLRMNAKHSPLDLRTEK
ncbi:hypothetical protein Syun_028950 [Stephania yunnanensis]|uniref:Uncharacterized protein n=1 Tax=Stephania yunnanensis TaxID=152371 RepID=A0AAP0E4R6_9MAGN